MTWIFANERQSSDNARLVLLAIGNYADETGEAWPSIRRLARDCNCSDRTIQRAVADLIGLGLLERTVQGSIDARIPTSARPNFYRILIHNNPVTTVTPGDSVVTPPGDNAVTPPVTALSPPPVTTLSPKTSLRTTIEPSKDLRPGAEVIHITEAHRIAAQEQTTNFAAGTTQIKNIKRDRRKAKATK